MNKNQKVFEFDTVDEINTFLEKKEYDLEKVLKEDGKFLVIANKKTTSYYYD